MTYMLILACIHKGSINSDVIRLSRHQTQPGGVYITLLLLALDLLHLCVCAASFLIVPLLNSTTSYYSCLCTDTLRSCTFLASMKFLSIPLAVIINWKLDNFHEGARAPWADLIVCRECFFCYILLYGRKFKGLAKLSSFTFLINESQGRTNLKPFSARKFCLKRRGAH